MALECVGTDDLQSEEGSGGERMRRSVRSIHYGSQGHPRMAVHHTDLQFRAQGSRLNLCTLEFHC